MKTIILTENQIKKVVDNLISEQNETKTETITVNFGAVWPMGKHIITPQQATLITNELTKITNFIKEHTGSKITIQIESGESQVTNKDREVTPAADLQPGELAKKRGQSMRNFLLQYFQSLVGKTLNEKDLPEIPEAKAIIGTTSYSGPGDLKNVTKLNQYKQEQFVRAVVTAEKNYDCIVGLQITIGYFKGKNKAEHACDEAIFELRMNGVPLGIVNLNNASLDVGVDNWRKNLESQKLKYEKRIQNFEKQLSLGNVKERDRKNMIGAPPSEEYPYWLVNRAKKVGYEDVNQFVNELNTINNSFKEYGRKSDGSVGGSRSQTFVLDGVKAKSIIENAPSNEIVLSIIPLVTKTGNYKIFYDKGSHADTPWVTIVNPKITDPLYNGEPNVGMQRGSTKETVLLKTDLCGNPPKATQS